MTEPRRASFEPADFTEGSIDPSHRCERCGRPFAREDWLALHLGNAHPSDLSEAEIDAFRSAHDAEEDDLRRFRLLALGGLVLIYFGLLLIYALLAL